MRLATYNVEWFASLFDQKDNLINDNSWSGRYDVKKRDQIAALGHVFQTLDADAIMIIEAPNSGGTQSSKAALETFAKRFKLRQNTAIVGFENDTQQEIALLYDPTKMEVTHDPQGVESGETGSRIAPRFDSVFKIDLDTDAEADTVTFSKPPLELALKPFDGPIIRLIGVHAKSKAPHGARTREEEVRISIANRRKQLAQCIWLRQRIDDHLAAGDELLVMGDFNDGPGLDEYEKLFGQSGVEIVLGVNKPASETLFDPHASTLLAPRSARPTTARFYNHKTKTYLNALLDYIMISPKLRSQTQPTWKIWHPFDHPQCFSDKTMCDALLTASDHFPVTIDLNFPPKG
ncbi:endonuclease/exonuclease/phosphatase family protein [Amylibacter sp. IMCC11727]|uniref:endonuclease/exonuclease/phosphatase family protein n=1 Tax=Amylibacter sp. IMCC11727 TaxID=3039851 RepID=UPI00244DE561|nr:endonuclease/exonuclease/phosphatase family protein [Amylibacter sp. IMCC11727]WGI20931.1 endonuclease/exonuclease/phosphatase family protein [Amylibacter sp. IMCC11727]